MAEQRPLVVQVRGMLDPVAVAVLVPRVGGTGEARGGLRHRIEHDVLVRRRLVPVDAVPAVPQARHVNERDPGIAAGAPHDAVGAPVPQIQRLRRLGHRETHVAAGAVDARLVDPGIGERLEGPRGRLVAHDSGAGLAPHPHEQAVLLALLQPYRLRLVVHGPAGARGFGHGADIEATQRRAGAHVGVPRRGRIGRERECLIVHRGEAARERASVADTRTGRARREVHQPVATVAVHQHGARAIAIRQRDLVAALGVVVTPVGAGGGESRGGEPVDRYAR